VNSVQLELSFSGLVEVLDSLREGIQILDPEFRYVYVNAAVCRHGRLKKEDLVGRKMGECYPGIESTETFAFLQHCMTERASATRRNHFQYPDGSQGTFELRVEPCSAGIVVLSIDVTEETRLATQLFHSQKMEALGRLAGGVAHDFNNLLSIILSFSELSLDSLPSDHQVRKDIEAVIAAAQKAARLTQQLLSFSRHKTQLPQPINLNTVIEFSTPILARLVGEGFGLTTDLAPDLGFVELEPAQADQLLLNLVVNAKDAMTQGGDVRIETRNVELGEPLRSDAGPLAPGSYVQLSVSDAGGGISPELRSRIFEPFFTTKGGRGTGLGLAIVFGIVRRADGGICLDSEPGKGTTFRIFLPRSSRELEAPNEPKWPNSVQGSETILVADDDSGVCAAVARVLESYGYRVLCAHSAQEAQECWATHQSEINLLLTDVVMPITDGIELALALRRDDPTLPVVFMTGFAERSLDDPNLQTGPTGYLSKPIAPLILGAKVRGMLEQARSPRGTMTR
jgi:two-component system, cell cycle sensor histidine kinase and response regulator CckA